MDDLVADLLPEFLPVIWHTLAGPLKLGDEGKRWHLPVLLDLPECLPIFLPERLPAVWVMVADESHS